MNDASSALHKALLSLASARAVLLTCQTNKSVVRHSLREKLRSEMAAGGEKVTETRLDDLAVAHDKYQKVCQDEVNATLAEGVASAEAEKARCAFEIAKLQFQARNQVK